VRLDDLAPLFGTIAGEVLARSVVTEPPSGADRGTVLELDDGETVRTATAWVIKA
jgi:hypothetical protein